MNKWAERAMLIPDGGMVRRQADLAADGKAAQWHAVVLYRAS